MAKKMLPPARPKMGRDDVEAMIAEHNVKDRVWLVAVRGYYRDTMGTPGKNDVGIYDDAFFLVSPTAFVSFNGNVDPSTERKHMANLKTGVWRYQIGKHKGYKALVQAGKVTVARYQEGDDSGYFGINIHKGGRLGTNSLGCQTVPPDQWPSFIALVESELKRHGQKVLPYVLTANV